MTTPEEHELRSQVRTKKVGLVLSGGGALGAYQAGVVRAVTEIAADRGIKKPLPIITGVSAGAVNATYLAAMCDDLHAAADQLVKMWSKIRAEDVFRTDPLSAGRSGLKFLTDATIGALYRKKLARSLLDTAPLAKFLEDHIPFANIDRNLAAGHLEALAVTATSYSSATSITFVHGSPQTPMWTRSRRLSTLDKVATEHVMASAAIPMFFPPVRIGDDHFGDGCLRNTAPLSPAIHLGADRLLVVSVRRPDNRAAPIDPNMEPSVARVLGVVLNALLLDAIDVDMERMSRVNSTLGFVPMRQRADLNLRPIDYLWIRPSQDIGHLAGELFDRLPRVIRYLISGLGSSREASELTSYLLFDPDFCGQLVHMGYEDGLAHREQIANFLSGDVS